MKIHHIRNATLVIESNDQVVLVDPMLGPKGTMPPFTLFRSKPKKNPTVDFPTSSKGIVEKTTHCLITHKHPDHLDKKGKEFLRERQIPVTCSSLDEKAFTKGGMNVVQTLEYWQPQDFLGGKITGVPALHGYGFVAKIAGDVMGFHIELPDSPTVYISSDTIYTEDVKKALITFKPDISVVAAGSAQFDFGKPLLMTLDDIVAFARDSPGKVIADHMEAVNHCPTTRDILRNRLKKEGLLDKTFIPEDGEVIEC